MAVKKKNQKYKIIIRSVLILLLVSAIIVTFYGPLEFLNFKKGLFKKTLEKLEPKYANAHYQYSPSSQSIIYGRGKANDFRSLGASDGVRWEIGTVAHGLDVVLNFQAINPRSANKIIIVYRGLTSTTTLNYQIQLCDYINRPGDLGGAACNESSGIWRNILDHGSTQDSTTFNSATDRSYLFHIFNGYFAGSSGNSPKDIPIGDFINNGAMKIRFYSTTTVPDYMLYLDFLQIEVVIDNFYLAGGVDVGNESVSDGQYTDTFVQDVARAGTCSGSQCLQVTNSGDGLNATLKFKNVAAPYQGANTILIYEYGYVTANNYYIDLCNSFDAAPSCLSWDTLNSTAYSNTSTIYHTVAKAGIAPSNYINNSNEMWVRIRMPASSGNYRMDYISATIGSTNASSSQSEISLGSSGANDSTYTGSLDNSTSSTGTSIWMINSALANATALQTTMYSDDGTGASLTEYGVSANVSVPVTPPDNSLVTEIVWAARWSMVGDTTISTGASL